MNQDLFYVWLDRVDRCIGAKLSLEILLPIENCSVHGKEEILSVLQNVGVEFLRPKTKRKVQPLDDGIIAWVKERYKRRLLLRVFENMDARSKTFTV